MTDEQAPAPQFWIDPRDRDPEVRKERVKLLVNVFTAIGIALIIGSAVAPFVDPTRSFLFLRTVLGVLAGIGSVLFAVWFLRYIKPKD